MGAGGEAVAKWSLLDQAGRLMYAGRSDDKKTIVNRRR